MNPYNIYICGVGGQGIIKTSIVIGEAGMKSNLEVVMSEIHGMSQRGGVVSTELKIGEARSPIIEDGKTDLLIAFEPMEALRAISKTSKNTYVIMNTSPILPFNIHGSEIPYPEVNEILEELKSKVKKIYAMDALEMAKDAGHILSLNMVMLGGAVAVSGFRVEKEAIIESIRENLPEKSIPINLKAFEDGYRFVLSK
ncbi:MAG: indolepyruvate oxidoreductase subunit beta [Methanobacterium sp.]